MTGTPLASPWSATGLAMSGVCPVTIRSTLVLEDQVGGDVRGPLGVGLAVPHDDLDVAMLARDGDSSDGVEVLLDLADHEVVGFPERRERTGLGGHVPDLDRATSGTTLLALDLGAGGEHDRASTARNTRGRNRMRDKAFSR